MIKDFKTASLMDLHLPVDLKERLWREKLVGNPALMNALSILSKNYVSTDAESRKIVKDVIETNRLIEKHAGDFFSYRGNEVPEEIYYALIARPFIRLEPKWFPHLPANYTALSEQLEILDFKPETIINTRIERPARFCHYIETVTALLNFRDGLRSGRISVAAPNPKNNYNTAEEWDKRYSLVSHVKEHFKPGFKIVGDARRITIDIDYFINHFGDDFSWYIQLGSKEKEKVLNADFLFDELKIEDVGRMRKTFNLTYEFYKAKNRGEDFSAYYEFCEKTLSPYHIFRSSFYELNEKTALIALTHHALSHMKDDDFKIKIPRRSLEALQTSVALTDLTFNSMRMWGSARAPFIMPDEMIDLNDILQATEGQSCHGTALDDHFQRHRERAIDIYNFIARKNEMEPYSP